MGSRLTKHAAGLLSVVFILIAWRPALATPHDVPTGLAAYRDLAYVPGGHERQKLDLYVPAAGEGPFPLIVWIHGGSWTYGSKEDCVPVPWALKGYAVASVNYRLSQDAAFPAQIEDCKAAIRWLRAHAREYRLDRDRLIAWGDSAGGHLAALLGQAQVAAFQAAQREVGRGGLRGHRGLRGAGDAVSDDEVAARAMAVFWNVGASFQSRACARSSTPSTSPTATIPAAASTTAPGFRCA